MKTEWSRRELYAHGEPFGDCATQRKLGGGYVCGGGGKGSTPPAPDYTGAAQAQGASSKEVTNMQTYANRPTQNTPWGTVTWDTGSTIDPGTGQAMTTWTQNYNLTPEARQALNAQLDVQNNRSQLAKSFTDRVRNEYSQPFNWGAMPSRGGNVGGSYFERLNDGPDLNRYVGTEGAQRMGGAPTLNANFSAGPSANQVGAAPSLQRSVATQGVQNSMNFGDNGALQGSSGADRQRIENALFERMDPQHQRQQSALDAKLANQGITAGSEAYKRAQQALGDQQSRERYDALQTAGQEMSRNAQIALANRGQLTQEDIAGANLYNSANNQAFSQALQAGQFGNTALQNQFGMANQAAQTNNAALAQDYAQRMGAQQAYNQALASQYGLGLQGTQANNAAIQQDYNQRLGAAQFGNTALQNQQSMDQNRLAFNNQVGQNQFAQQMQQSQYQNQLRQAAIAEEMQRRGMSLNEMNALLTGQQVGMQQMPQFNAAAAAQPTQYLNAANMQYQANLDAANMQNANANSTMNGLFNLGGSLGSAGMMAYALSDGRLKKIIRKIGEKNGFSWYLFKYIGSNTEHEGVIAQEVQKVKPEAVKRHTSGYLMVNYAALEA